MWHHFPCHLECAIKVSVYDTTPSIDVYFPKFGRNAGEAIADKEHTNTSVVNQHMNPTELLLGLLNDPLAFLWIAYVGDDGYDFTW